MKILMVITPRDKLGNTGRKTGFWLEEFAARISPERFRVAFIALVLFPSKRGKDREYEAQRENRTHYRGQQRHWTRYCTAVHRRRSLCLHHRQARSGVVCRCG